MGGEGRGRLAYHRYLSAINGCHGDHLADGDDSGGDDSGGDGIERERIWASLVDINLQFRLGMGRAAGEVHVELRAGACAWRYKRLHCHRKWSCWRYRLRGAECFHGRQLLVGWSQGF